MVWTGNDELNNVHVCISFTRSPRWAPLCDCQRRWCSERLSKSSLSSGTYDMSKNKFRHAVEFILEALYSSKCSWNYHCPPNCYNISSWLCNLWRIAVYCKQRPHSNLLQLIWFEICICVCNWDPVRLDLNRNRFQNQVCLFRPNFPKPNLDSWNHETPLGGVLDWI